MASLQFEKVIYSNIGRKRYEVYMSFEPRRKSFSRSEEFISKVIEVLKIKYPDCIDKILNELADWEILKLYFSGSISLKDGTKIGQYVEGSIHHMLYQHLCYRRIYKNH
jgi:hypothetical protein